MGEFLTNQAILFGYGTFLFGTAVIGDRLPFRIRQGFGWSSLGLWAIMLVSFVVPELNSLTLLLINSGVEALWKMTG